MLICDCVLTSRLLLQHEDKLVKKFFYQLFSEFFGMIRLRMQHEDEVVRLEREHEEKVLFLLRQLPGQQEVTQEHNLSLNLSCGSKGIRTFLMDLDPNNWCGSEDERIRIQFL